MPAHNMRAALASTMSTGTAAVHSAMELSATRQVRSAAHPHAWLCDIFSNGGPHSDASTQHGGCICRLHCIRNFDCQVATAPEPLCKATSSPAHDCCLGLRADILQQNALTQGTDSDHVGLVAACTPQGKCSAAERVDSGF